MLPRICRTVILVVTALTRDSTAAACHRKGHDHSHSYDGGYASSLGASPLSSSFFANSYPTESSSSSAVSSTLISSFVRLSSSLSVIPSGSSESISPSLSRISNPSYSSSLASITSLALPPTVSLPGCGYIPGAAFETADDLKAWKVTSEDDGAYSWVLGSAIENGDSGGLLTMEDEDETISITNTISNLSAGEQYFIDFLFSTVISNSADTAPTFIVEVDGVEVKMVIGASGVTSTPAPFYFTARRSEARLKIRVTDTTVGGDGTFPAFQIIANTMKIEYPGKCAHRPHSSSSVSVFPTTSFRSSSASITGSSSSSSLSTSSSSSSSIGPLSTCGSFPDQPGWPEAVDDLGRVPDWSGYSSLPDYKWGWQISYDEIDDKKSLAFGVDPLDGVADLITTISDLAHGVEYLVSYKYETNNYGQFKFFVDGTQVVQVDPEQPALIVDGSGSFQFASNGTTAPFRIQLHASAGTHAGLSFESFIIRPADGSCE